jgi:hypothetical protein
MQEAARSLDGVNGAKNAPQQIRIVRVFLEFDEILIQARKVFVTLDQKLTNRFLIFRARVAYRDNSAAVRNSAPADNAPRHFINRGRPIQTFPGSIQRARR